MSSGPFAFTIPEAVQLNLIQNSEPALPLGKRLKVVNSFQSLPRWVQSSYSNDGRGFSSRPNQPNVVNPSKKNVVDNKAALQYLQQECQNLQQSISDIKQELSKINPPNQTVTDITNKLNELETKLLVDSLPSASHPIKEDVTAKTIATMNDIIQNQNKQKGRLDEIVTNTQPYDKYFRQISSTLNSHNETLIKIQDMQNHQKRMQDIPKPVTRKDFVSPSDSELSDRFVKLQDQPVQDLVWRIVETSDTLHEIEQIIPDSPEWEKTSDKIAETLSDISISDYLEEEPQGVPEETIPPIVTDFDSLAYRSKNPSPESVSSQSDLSNSSSSATSNTDSTQGFSTPLISSPVDISDLINVRQPGDQRKVSNRAPADHTTYPEPYPTPDKTPVKAPLSHKAQRKLRQSQNINYKPPTGALNANAPEAFPGYENRHTNAWSASQGFLDKRRQQAIRDAEALKELEGKGKGRGRGRGRGK